MLVPAPSEGVSHRCVVRVRDCSYGSRAVEAIAVVGLATGFPQDINSPESLWKAMLEERCTVGDFPHDREDITPIWHPDQDGIGQIAVKRAHFLDQDLSEFDAKFFSISTSDAASMDPQQRLLLEYTYKALENAGLTLEQVAGSRTSCYVSSLSTEPQHLNFRHGTECAVTVAAGASPSLVANRISRFFDFKGNSADVDTSRSNDLLCLNMGVQGLRTGKHDMSVIAGSNIIASPDDMHSMTNMYMLSPEGRSYSFDERANGYGRGEGFGVLVLKRVSDAIRDGDTIRGIIRHSRCNPGRRHGMTPSMAVPSGDAQFDLIRQAYAEANLDMTQTRYLEAHGTGTPIGDLVEACAFGTVFRETRSEDDRLYVGAAKANIGHLEGASGIASFVRALLVLEKAVIPPICGLQNLNSKIDAEYLRLKFPTEAAPWPTRGLRRASVNSLGNGGMSTHVVLDDVYHFLEEHAIMANHVTRAEPPKRVSSRLPHESDGEFMIPSYPRDVPHLLVFSAADQAGTHRIGKSYESYFSKLDLVAPQDNIYLDNLRYTLAKRRSHLPWRSYALVKNARDLSALSDLVTPSKLASPAPGVGFIFTGRAVQWAALARSLLVFPAFEASLERLGEILFRVGSHWKLSDAVENFSQERASDPSVSHSLCTGVQIALVQLLRDWNLLPTCVVGHGSGEVAAAYCTGALSEESALKIAYWYGSVAADIPTIPGLKGGMLDVSLSEERAREFLSQAVQIDPESTDMVVACINGPRSVTFSGRESEVLALQQTIDDHHIFNRRLPGDVAYHSPQTEVMHEKLRSKLRNLRPGLFSSKPVAMISTVTGKQVSPAELLSADYWVDNLGSPVQFSLALENLVSRRADSMMREPDLHRTDTLHLDVLLEIGSDLKLKAPIEDILADLPRAETIDYVSFCEREESAVISFLCAIGQLHCLGCPIDVVKTAPVRGRGRDKVLTDLPPYPFDHSKKYRKESGMRAHGRV